MWDFVKILLTKSRLLNQAFGDVVFETPEIKGASSHSFFQLRVKRSVEGGEYFVAIRMRPDAYTGPGGSPTNYINFGMEAAQRLKLNLDRCVAEYHRLLGDASTRGDDVRRDHR